MKFAYSRTTKVEEIIDVPDGIYFVKTKFQGGDDDHFCKIIILGDASEITRVYINNESENVNKEVLIKYSKDCYGNLPYFVEALFAKDSKSEFIDEEIFNKQFQLAMKYINHAAKI